MKKTELAIGTFVFTALVLLAVMIISFGKYQYLGNRYIIYAVFNFVSGVVEGAPVRYAGVDVGKVVKARVFENDEGFTKVKLSLQIDEKIKIKKDTEAVINSLGIIGEKYVELFPGSPNAPVLKANEELVGVDPVALESVMANAQKVLKKLEGALGAVNDILTDETKKDIKAAIVNFKNFGRDIDRLTKKIGIIVNKINTGQGTIGKLIYAQELHDELLALIKGIREHGIFYKAKTQTKEVKKVEKMEKSFGPRK